MSKSPISALQEYTQQKQIDVPKYIYVDVGTLLAPKFKCIVMVNNKVAEATCVNKKTAKHNAALEALKMIDCNNNYPSTPVTPVRIPGMNSNSVITPTTEISNLINFVGALNEYASINGQSYPTYDTGIIPSPGGYFTVYCYFMGHVTTGTGLNKKTAKQDSAKEMLQSIKSAPSTPNIRGVPPVPKKLKLDEDDEELKVLVTKFKQLSPSAIPLDRINAMHTQPLNFTKLFDTPSGPNDTDRILEQLKLNGIKIEVFQQKPLVLKAKISDTKILFSHGVTMEEATDKLLSVIGKVCG